MQLLACLQLIRVGDLVGRDQRSKRDAVLFCDAGETISGLNDVLGHELMVSKLFFAHVVLSLLAISAYGIFKE